MEFPDQINSTRAAQSLSSPSQFDIRSQLTPSRLTMAMWDQAFLLRHIKGGSFENYANVLAETQERGYNTVRLDPMPHLIDLVHPERIVRFVDPKTPYMPWGWNTEVKGPIGVWLLEFMQELYRTKLYYTLSTWWFTHVEEGPQPLYQPKTHLESFECWYTFLTKWKQTFGFDRLVYVDIANEVPYFLPGYKETFENETGCDWHYRSDQFTNEQIHFLASDLNGCLHKLQEAFPEVRFTASIHGDTRWLDVPVEFDCIDAHFYVSADPRWNRRTRFNEQMGHLFTEHTWHKEFSERCKATFKSVGPMIHQRQRQKLAQFADWAVQRGMPLTTTESWASWYYFDSPDLDWSWLLEWAEWSVEDAIEFKMWGWTPHNYVQPQFENWKDVRWHQRLTKKFLQS